VAREVHGAGVNHGAAAAGVLVDAQDIRHGGSRSVPLRGCGRRRLPSRLGPSY
jgi:hypothetical protein